MIAALKFTNLPLAQRSFYFGEDFSPYAQVVSSLAKSARDATRQEHDKASRRLGLDLLFIRFTIYLFAGAE